VNPSPDHDATSHDRAAQLIATLGLKPHPEGGHYREVFRSSVSVQPGDGRGERCGLTTIYFLLNAGEQSRLHRVTSDEAWHFYEGDPLDLLWMGDEPTLLHQARLGPVEAGMAPVAVVPAGSWQAARSSGAYTLVGCSVGPGFDFADFQMLGDHPELARELCERHSGLRPFV
jgi:predicted cupin superfamily sugar epimerase